MIPLSSIILVNDKQDSAFPTSTMQWLCNIRYLVGYMLAAQWKTFTYNPKQTNLSQLFFSQIKKNYGWIYLIKVFKYFAQGCTSLDLFKQLNAVFKSLHLTVLVCYLSISNKYLQFFFKKEALPCPHNLDFCGCLSSVIFFHRIG